MGIIEIFLTGVGLAIDAFAASVCRGLSMKKINYKHALIIALMFGGFQALMPLIGWALGKSFESYMSAFSPWVAFLLLSYIGGKMLYDGIKGEDECDCCQNEGLRFKQLFGMAIATSIDALAVGVSFGVGGVSIFSSITIIGVTTFFIALLGVVIGNRFGEKYNKRATIAGGVILVGIGIKILVESFFK